MSYNHLPRVPVRFIEENQELIKSQDTGGRLGATDYKQTESLVQGQLKPEYRYAADREHGNVSFRRNPDGSLCFDNAKNLVVDAIHKVKNGSPLNSLETAILSICFPGVFPHSDPTILESIQRVTLKITPEEKTLLAAKVAAHLSAELQFMLSSHAR